MNQYLSNLKENYFYSIMVTMILSGVMLMMYNTMVDETICHEPDYKGNVNECINITNNFKQNGWILFIPVIVIGISAGIYHVFPESKTKPDTPFTIVFSIIMAVISLVLFTAPLASTLSDEEYEKYQYIFPVFNIVIFFLAFRKFGGRWFWQA